MKTMTAEKAYRQVAMAAEKIKSDDREVVATMSPGDVCRQGDIYLVCLDREPKTTGTAPSRQLAPGDTQGSRHVAAGECEVLVADEREAKAALNRLVPATKAHVPFVGPVIRAPLGVEITHPEHGDRVLPPGSYLVIYQRAWANEVRRQAD